MLRIAVFYDGNFFYRMSTFYKYGHAKQARIDYGGFHRFVQARIAEFEECDRRRCELVEKHYFCGLADIGMSIAQARLENDRRRDEVLRKAGITPHYFPVIEYDNTPREKGVDVGLAVEATKLALGNRFDILALVACDTDYVPLVQELRRSGKRVLLIGGDFKYEDKVGAKTVETRTSKLLISEANYSILLNEEVDSRSKGHDPLIDDLFH